MMAGEQDELRKAQEEVRRAREEFDRLRNRAREIERELREQGRRARHQAHEERHGPGFSFRPAGVPPFPDPPGPDGEGVRQEQSLPLAGVRSITIDQTAGKLVVRTCTPEEQPGIVTSSNKTPPRLEVRRNGDQLQIEVRLSVGWLFRRRTGATTVVRLTPGFAELKVSVGAGEINIHDIACGEITLNSGAGEIKTFSTEGMLRADTGAGRIQVNAHRGLARCDSGTGDVSIDIARLDPGEYRANVGMGRVEIRLPEGHEVHIKAASGIGKSKVDYPLGPESAAIKVRVETGIGEASVRRRPPDGAVPPRPAPAGSKPQRDAREATRRRRESEELRVLQLLEQGKISTQEAADLIAALQDSRFSFDDEDGGER
jgi:hypothetical protein